MQIVTPWMYFAAWTAPACATHPTMWHKGSLCTFHTAALGLNHGTANSHKGLAREQQLGFKLSSLNQGALQIQFGAKS